MADDTTSRTLMFLVIFWTLLAIFTQIFHPYLGNEQLGPELHKDTDNSNILSIINDNPLFRLLTFQYSENVPFVFTLFLDGMFVISIYILYAIIRG